MKSRPPHRSRRQFLKQSAAAAAAIGFWPAWSRAAGANSDIRIGILGLGNKGKNHVRLFSSMAGARIVALCDVDPTRLASQVELLKQERVQVFSSTDPRRVIDRDDVDAVVIATPNHWHALLSVWAMRAGKDVYVEKPVSHSIWEGMRLVEEAKATGRIVQGGTQYRSCPGLREAAAWLKAGNMGPPLSAHVLWYEYREPIGSCAPFTPSELDYDLWCGPAPLEPLIRPRLHYDWHWFWSTGNGDMGNSAVHAVDACRMFLDVPAFPSRIRCAGGRLAFQDAGETPNCQFVIAEYPELPMFIEFRNHPNRKGSKVMDHLRGLRRGMVIQYEGGYFAGLSGGGTVYDAAGKVIRSFPGDSGASHGENFIAAVRSRRQAGLNAPIAEGHVSSAICHWSNISYRLGMPRGIDSGAAAFAKHQVAADGLSRAIASLKGIDIDLDQTPLVYGPELRLDPGSGRLHEPGDVDYAAAAQQMARGSHRASFAFPA